ncbi:hypothetical protein PHYPSEUDO_011623 [Phytophthora pseudosyringae]|uniref:RxLR effector protein n=1 Tax=Phytophthora pseudosyringae TaxID=221518 RepID=A0A8T1V820_9STRA|nr:hypothetical protein PHYPSEUDO_011623 [Phytophthora pseudosyringae]
MGFGYFLALLLATCIVCYSNVANAEQTILEADSIRTSFRSESAEQAVQGRKLTVEAEETTVDAEDEERGVDIINKLKTLLQKSTQSVKFFQKNPAVVREVESLKNSPVVAQSLKTVKENPVMMKQINTLNQHPEVLTSLQNAPAAQSVDKLQTFLTKGQTRGTDAGHPGFLVSFFLIMGGFIATLLLVNFLTQA